MLQDGIAPDCKLLYCVDSVWDICLTQCDHITSVFNVKIAPIILQNQGFGSIPDFQILIKLRSGGRF